MPQLNNSISDLCEKMLPLSPASFCTRLFESDVKIMQNFSFCFFSESLLSVVCLIVYISIVCVTGIFRCTGYFETKFVTFCSCLFCWNICLTVAVTTQNCWECSLCGILFDCIMPLPILGTRPEVLLLRVVCMYVCLGRGNPEWLARSFQFSCILIHYLQSLEISC